MAPLPLKRICGRIHLPYTCRHKVVLPFPFFANAIEKWFPVVVSISVYLIFS